MQKKYRIILIIISLLLIGTYFFPIWQIDLQAPQYPEGLGMKIWINKISGDLNTINGLNHYIGMKKIEPDSIAELTIMPYVVAGLIFIGLVVGFTGKKWMLMLWVSLFITAGAVGLYDFYMWEYDYGHNLDTTAAIKVPGMSYQPPLIGSKKLLNFNASSLPDIGAYIFFGVALIAILILIVELKRKKTGAQLKKNVVAVITFLFLSASLSGCSNEPEPINFGSDECSHCRMTIMNNKYGAEILTSKGKVYKFDATECMIAYLSESQDKHDKDLMFVIDASDPGKLIPAKDAFYLISENLRSPMGENLTAFGDKSKAEEFREKYHGNIYNFNEVKSILNGHKH